MSKSANNFQLQVALLLPSCKSSGFGRPLVVFKVVEHLGAVAFAITAFLSNLHLTQVCFVSDFLQSNHFQIIEQGLQLATKSLLSTPSYATRASCRLLVSALRTQSCQSRCFYDGILLMITHRPSVVSKCVCVSLYEES